MSEEELYRKARKKDAHWYTLALLIIVIGFFSTDEIFNGTSIISIIVLGFWAMGVARMGKLYSELLDEAEPVVKRLMSDGYTEHDAMIKTGIDKFYYKPFWSIR